MTTFLVILLIGAMLATVAALVRGIVTFLKTSTDELREGQGPSASSVKSNKMMQARILFQALAILIVVLLLFAAGKT